jgi:hypothetical protein
LRNGVDDVQPHVISLSPDDMCTLWSKTESNGNATYGAYFAAVMLPWSVTLTMDASNASDATVVTAVVTYSCPAAIVDCDDGPVATTSVANLTLPASLVLASGSSNGLSVPLGPLSPGAAVTVVWEVTPAADVVYGAPSRVGVVAAGLISAGVPEYAGYYPAYNYSDWIGGDAWIAY